MAKFVPFKRTFLLSREFITGGNVHEKAKMSDEIYNSQAEKEGANCEIRKEQRAQKQQCYPTYYQHVQVTMHSASTVADKDSLHLAK